jgi:hypothetical protein
MRLEKSMYNAMIQPDVLVDSNKIFSKVKMPLKLKFCVVSL